MGILNCFWVNNSVNVQYKIYLHNKTLPLSVEVVDVCILYDNARKNTFKK